MSGSLLVGCGGEDERRSGEETPAVDLTVTVRGPGGEQQFELQCEPDDERRPCETARRLTDFLASEPPRDRVCTQIYGGPETGRIVGTIGERRIDRRFSKTNGCEIADWRRAEPLLRLASG